jgi:hypothetical protein
LHSTMTSCAAADTDILATAILTTANEFRFRGRSLGMDVILSGIWLNRMHTNG